MKKVVVLIMVLVFLLTACAPAQPAVKSLKFQMSWVPDAGQFVPFVTTAQGFFKEENLEVELVPGGPEVGKLAISLADTGKVDIASMGSAQNFIKANLEGANTIAIAQTFQASPAGLLYIIKYPDGRAGKSILKTAADAKGKRLGLQSGALLTWDMMALKAGLKKEDYTIVSVGSDPTPLIDGTIDAFWGYDTNVIPALKVKGYEIGHLKAFDAGVPTPGDFIFVNKDFLKDNKDAVCRFMKAFEKGAAYGVEHPDVAVNYAMDKYSKDFKLVKAEQAEMANVIVNNYLKPYKTAQGYHYVNLQNWQTTIDQLFEQKAITSKPALKDVVTTEITECVTKK